jgi:pimeloyl-ACP methyl ester carboxylesterase
VRDVTVDEVALSKARGRRRAVRWILHGGVAVLAALGVLLAGALLYRAWAQRENARLLVIDTTHGIDEGGFVSIGGVPQWITVRGHDRRNPVVLVLHGGPGGPMVGQALPLLEWERDFVVAHWHQPGAGRTFGAAGRRIDPAATIESVARDGILVAEHLARQLGAERIVLVGWSWGSALGIHMVKARPDLFAAFFGTGQVVNMREGEAVAYARVLAKAKDRGDVDAIADLERIGPPPYDSLDEIGTQRKWAGAYEDYGTTASLLVAELLAPRTSLRDVYDLAAGLIQSQDHFFGPSMDKPFVNADLRRLGPRFEVPVFVVQGVEDDYTPPEVSRSYVEWIEAPVKEFVGLEGGGHFALVSHASEFLAILKERLRRLQVGMAVIDSPSSNRLRRQSPTANERRRANMSHRPETERVERGGKPIGRVAHRDS